MRGAVMRDPALRASATEWWGKQKLFGEIIREDEAVQRMAEKLGYGFVDGEAAEGREMKLRMNAQAAVNALKSGIAPPPSNAQPQQTNA